MKTLRNLSLGLLLIVMLTACAQAQEIILTVDDQAYTQPQLEALGTKSVEYTNKDGETTTFSGVPLTSLLSQAGINDIDAKITFTAADGYEADMPLSEAIACEECIIAFDDGSLSMVMPNHSSKLQVRDVVEISSE